MNTVQQMISVGSAIRTDRWPGHTSLSDFGYIHLPMSNQKGLLRVYLLTRNDKK